MKAIHDFLKEVEYSSMAKSVPVVVGNNDVKLLLATIFHAVSSDDYLSHSFRTTFYLYSVIMPQICEHPNALLGQNRLGT